MPSYAVAERRLASAIDDLRNYLWAGARPDERDLARRLMQGARALDRHHGTRGRVERAIRPMTRRFRRGSQGADLWTFLQAVAGLSYAADRVHRRPKEAAKAASGLTVSLSLRLGSAAGARELVDAFESGRDDFGEFIVRLQEALEARGVLRAAEFGRAANLAFDIHALWSGKASPHAKRVLATASVASAGFACVVFLAALRALGRYRETPYAFMIPAVAAVLEGLGGQP